MARRLLLLASWRDLAEDLRQPTRQPNLSGEAGMDIEAWLRGLGLEQYAPAFRANDIDAEVLPYLIAEDLIGLGVISIGHRRKLLAAITALRDEPAISSEKSAQTTAQAAREIPEASLSSSAERRQLTVMFCDLVGSTARTSAR